MTFAFQPRDYADPRDMQDEIVARIKGALTNEWQTCVQISKACGVHRNRLPMYFARWRDRGEVDYRTGPDGVVQYRNLQPVPSAA